MVCPEAEVLVNMLVKDPVTPLSLAEQRKLNIALVKDRKLKQWGLDPSPNKSRSKSKLDQFIGFLEEYHSKTKPGSSVIVFKAVDLVNYVEILQDYGIEKGLNFYFISLIRDPRAIFNSQSQTFVESRKKIMNRNPLSTVYQWNYLISQSINYASSEKFLILKFEDLVNNLEGNLLSILRLIGIKETCTIKKQQGDLILRIPKDQLSMHPHIEDLPIPGKVDQWQAELKISIQVLIQRSATEALLRMGYILHPINIPVMEYVLLRVRYKTDLALKDLYRKFRKIF